VNCENKREKKTKKMKKKSYRRKEIKRKSEEKVFIIFSFFFERNRGKRKDRKENVLYEATKKTTPKSV
jgi:hypothetical protein